MDGKDDHVCSDRNRIARGSFAADPGIGNSLRRLANGQAASLVAELKMIGSIDRLHRNHLRSVHCQDGPKEAATCAEISGEIRQVERNGRAT